MKKHFETVLIGVILFNLISQEQTSKTSAQKEISALEKDGKDPVCAMKVKKGTLLVSMYKEKQHGFCSKSCKEKFDKDPEKFVKK